MARSKTIVKRVTRQQTRPSRDADVAKVSITRSHQNDGHARAARRPEYAKCSIFKINIVLLMLIIMGFLAHTSRATSVSEGKPKPRGLCFLFHQLFCKQAIPVCALTFTTNKLPLHVRPLSLPSSLLLNCKPCR